LTRRTFPATILGSRLTLAAAAIWQAADTPLDKLLFEK
jgi:hypothetical protein